MNVRKALCLLSFLLVLTQVISCGGGTRGSGVGDIQGRVMYVDGLAVSDVAIEALYVMGVQDVTDANGNFILNFDDAADLQDLPEIISLELNGRQIMATVEVSAPSESSDVVVVITINPQTNGVSNIVEQEQPRPTPTMAPPVATRTPRPTNTPSLPAQPTRTATPEAPTFTPVATPTPIATGTSSPRATPTRTVATRTPTPRATAR